MGGGLTMTDKRVIAAGFLGGVAIGIAIFTTGMKPALPQGGRTAAHPTLASEPEATQYPARSIAFETRRQPQEASAMPTFNQMVAQVTASQGGKISIGQMAMLAEIYSQQYGTPPPYRDRQFDHIRVGPVSTPSDPYAALRRTTPSSSSPSDDTVVTSYAGRRSTDGAYETGPAAREHSDRRLIPRSSAVSVIRNPVAPDVYFDSNAVEDVPARRPNIGAIEIGSGQHFAPAGPGAYIDPRDGTYYAPAGPNGVVNTRTGAFGAVHR